MKLLNLDLKYIKLPKVMSRYHELPMELQLDWQLLLSPVLVSRVRPASPLPSKKKEYWILSQNKVLLISPPSLLWIEIWKYETETRDVEVCKMALSVTLTLVFMVYTSWSKVYDSLSTCDKRFSLSFIEFFPKVTIYFFEIRRFTLNHSK